MFDMVEYTKTVIELITGVSLSPADTERMLEEAEREIEQLEVEK